MAYVGDNFKPTLGQQHQLYLQDLARQQKARLTGSGVSKPQERLDALRRVRAEQRPDLLTENDYSRDSRPVSPLPDSLTLAPAGGSLSMRAAGADNYPISPLPDDMTMMAAGGTSGQGFRTNRPQMAPKDMMSAQTPQMQQMTTNLGKLGEGFVSGTPKQYQNLIAQAAQQFGVPPKLLSALLKQESGFAQDVVTGARRSSAGALGIAQFMPATAKAYGIDPLDPTQAIPAAARYLAGNYKNFGSWELALAAYNAGGGNVGKYGGIPPFPETQNYVRRIMQMVREEGNGY